MLYKKYHRNFVKQFRKGSKIKSKRTACLTWDTVEEEPYVFSREIHIASSAYSHWLIVLVDSRGQLAKDINVI